MRHPTEEEHLHRNASVGQMMELHRRTMQEEVRSLSEHQIKTTPTDKLVASLTDKFSINIPDLDDSNPSVYKREIDIDMSRRHQYDFVGGPAVVKGTEVTISVPYTGDMGAFRMHAGSHTMDYPLARLSDNAVTFSRRGANLDPAQLRGQFDAWLATIKQHLAGMRAELGNFNAALGTEIASAINARFEKIQRDDDLLGGLGFGGAKVSP